MRPTPRASVSGFFLLTYGASWAFFLPVAASDEPTITPLQSVLVTLGAFAPAVVALWLTRRSGAEGAVRRLIAPVFHWRVAAGWYAAAAGFMAAIKLAAAVMVRVTTGDWPRFGTDSLVLIPFAIAFSTPFQAGEEIGWRGYALPRLGSRFGLGGASILLGVIWATWHLPLFFVRGADTYGQSFILYLLQVTALSVVFAWLYGRTRSLLLVMLLHAAVNNSSGIVPSALPGASDPFGLAASPSAWMVTALLWIAAACCLARMPSSVPGAPHET